MDKSELFEKAYAGSYYTIEGAGGNLEDWKNGYSKMVAEAGIGEITAWYDFVGEEMNEYYGLTGSNAYPQKFQFLSFPLDGLDVGSLAMFKMQMGDRWFDDIVDNNSRRQKALDNAPAEDDGEEEE